jgi:porphobilinogen synthase
MLPRPVVRDLQPSVTSEAPAAGAPSFPSTRMRRNRQSPWVRNLVAENALSVNDLVWTGFVVEGVKKRVAIPSMPGVFRYSIDELVAEVQELAALGLNAIALFPCLEPDQKDDKGSLALDPDNLICRAVRAVRQAAPEIGIICDVALDPFTSHAHDGLIRAVGPLAPDRLRGGDSRSAEGMAPSAETSREKYVILNDETVDVLCHQAVLQARAGASVIAPSDMMDGRIGAIRKSLDSAGFQDVILLSYAAKYASAYYGPFRDALNNRGMLKGDKKTYQMDPANSDEALREVAMDLNEGADMVMVKPGLPYLDIIARVKQTFGVPTFAYQVSGEYAMLRGAIDNGWVDERILLETMLAFKRAGADAILTYAAKDIAKLIK